MDDLLTIAKVIGAAGGGTALLVWVMTRPHVVDALKHLTDWYLRHRAQSADLRMRESDNLAVVRNKLIDSLMQDVEDLRNRIGVLERSNRHCSGRILALIRVSMSVVAVSRSTTGGNRSVPAEIEELDRMLKKMMDEEIETAMGDLPK